MKKQAASEFTELNLGNLIAILWVLVGTLLFSIIFASSKVFDTEVSPITLVFVRYVAGSLIMIILKLTLSFELTAPTPKVIGMHAIRALSGGIGGVAAIYAASSMSVTKAASIGLLDGAIAVVLGVVFLRERITMLRMIGLALSLLAAYQLVFNGSVGASAWIGQVNSATFMAFLGAFLMALEAVLIKVLSQRETAHSVLFYVNALGAFIFAAPGIWLLADVSWTSILSICLLGPIAILGQYCFTFGYRSADLAIVGPVGYSWIVFAAAIGFIIGEPFNITVLVSSILIVFSGFVLIFDKENAPQS